MYQTTQGEINTHHFWVHATDIAEKVSECLEKDLQTGDVICDNCEDRICDLCDKETFPDVTKRIVCIGVETYEAIKSPDMVCRHHAGLRMLAYKIDQEASTTECNLIIFNNQPVDMLGWKLWN